MITTIKSKETSWKRYTCQRCYKSKALPIKIGQCWQVHVFHPVSLPFIAMLASVSFPPCFLTFYSSDRSLLSFLNLQFLNYSCMFTFYGLAITIAG